MVEQAPYIVCAGACRYVKIFRLVAEQLIAYASAREVRDEAVLAQDADDSSGMVFVRGHASALVLCRDFSLIPPTTSASLGDLSCQTGFTLGLGHERSGIGCSSLFPALCCPFPYLLQQEFPFEAI